MPDVIQPFLSATTVSILSNCWSVPAGVVLLYFYGKLHFNTPTYPIEMVVSAGGVLTDKVRLIAQAPPKFTTRRSRYNSYAWRYIALLELSFVFIIFCYTIINDIARAEHVVVPDLTSESLEYRSIFALLVLTGVLSSFPGLKQLDFWILSSLHRAAFIPDDVRDFAGRLCQSRFEPPRAVKTAVRPTVSMRDTARVADGHASGSLEKRIYELLCLRQQIQIIMKDDRYKGFKSHLDQDFAEVTSRSQNLRNEVVTYLRSQERQVPSDVTDIDDYLEDNIQQDGINELLDRRNELRLKCEAQFELLCLILGVTLFAANFALEDINKAIHGMGFEATIPRIPSLDWDAVMKVTGSAVLLILLFNGLYAFVFTHFGLFSNAATFVPTKDVVFRFAILFSIAYTIVMYLAIQMKRRWRRLEQASNRHENLVIAVAAYFCTVWVNCLVNLYVTMGHMTYAPFLFALNQLVLGYFIGVYLDRLIAGKPLSLSIPLYQALVQSVAMGVAASLSPTLFSTSNYDDLLKISIVMGAFSMAQGAASGFVVGVLFQHFYNNANALTAETDQSAHIDQGLAARA